MKKKNENLTSYMADIARQLEEEERFGTAHVYRSTLHRILDFTKGNQLPFKTLTPLWLKSFQNYLLTRHLQWNSISTYMRMLRAIYFRAVDAGLMPYRPRLFKGVYTGTRSLVKRALNEEEFRKLDITPSDRNNYNDIEKTRQLFLLLFMLRGIPFVDIAYLRHCDLHGDFLTYRRRKTGSWLNVRIEPQAMKLIHNLRSKNPNSPYLFPFIQSINPIKAYRQYQSALRKFNRNLKELGTGLGLSKPLSSYAARHSWATLANFHQFSPELICNAMGLSSVKVTETYFKNYSEESIGKMNREILSAIFSIQNTN